jgi:hypothetical protein
MFVNKLRDISGLYLDPPLKAMPLCVDEKSQLQALDIAAGEVIGDRLSRVRSLPGHAHRMRGLRGCLACQQQAPREQSPPHRLLQSLRCHALHPRVAKCRCNA